MSEEPTQRDSIARVTKEELTLPRTGVITNIREHTQSDDRWNFHVDLRLRPGENETRVPVATAIPDLIAPPRTESHPDGPDLALVQYLQDDEEERPIVTNILYNRKDRPPLGKEGMIRVVRGSLYLEADPRGDWVRMGKKPADDGTPSTKVEIDDSGATVQLNIKTDGDINISAGGDIVIDEGGTAVPVATESHTHDFSYDGGGDNSSTLNGTTGTPSDTTETEIE